MGPSINAASSSGGSSSVAVCSASRDKGKGKQLEQFPPANKISPLLTAEGDLSGMSLTLVERTYGPIDRSSLDEAGSSIRFPIPTPSLHHRAQVGLSAGATSTFIQQCDSVFANITEDSLKQVGLEKTLLKLKDACQAQLKNIQDLQTSHQVELIAKLGLWTQQKCHDTFLQQRFTKATTLLESVRNIIDGVAVIDAIDSFEEIEPIDEVSRSAVLREKVEELDLPMRTIMGEITALEKGLPPPVRAFLWVVFFAAVLVPLAVLVWYSLAYLGLFSMTAALPQALAGSAWVAVVIAGILKSWPDYRNACAERVSETPQKLVASYKAILTVHEEVKSKMSEARSIETHRLAYSGAALSAIGIDKTTNVENGVHQLGKDTTEIKTLLKQLAETSSKSSNSDLDAAKNEIAWLRAENALKDEMLAKSEAERKQLLEALMKRG